MRIFPVEVIPATWRSWVVLTAILSRSCMKFAGFSPSWA